MHPRQNPNRTLKLSTGIYYQPTKKSTNELTIYNQINEKKQQFQNKITNNDSTKKTRLIMCLSNKGKKRLQPLQSIYYPCYSFEEEISTLCGWEKERPTGNCKNDNDCDFDDSDTDRRDGNRNTSTAFRKNYNSDTDLVCLSPSTKLINWFTSLW